MCPIWSFPDEGWSGYRPEDGEKEWIRNEIDEVLTDRVACRLVADVEVQGRRVQVSVQNCVVILEGVVGSEDSRQAAGRQAWVTVGVTDVCNMLSVDDRCTG